MRLFFCNLDEDQILKRLVVVKLIKYNLFCGHSENIYNASLNQ